MSKGRWLSSYSFVMALALGIVVPSAFLTYSGLRSFRYERMLLQKQTEERYANLGDALQRRAAEALEGVVSSLGALAGSQAFIDWNAESMAAQLLAVRRLGPIAVRQFWVVDQNERLWAPVRQDPPEIPQATVLNWGPLGAAIQRFEQLEISGNRVREALKGYQSVDRKGLPLILQAALLKMIAADEQKLGDWEASEQHYSQLKRDYDQTPDPTGLPAGLIVSELLGNFYAATHQEAKAAPLFLDFEQALLLNHWPLARKDQRQWIERVENALEGLRSSKAWTDALQMRRRRLWDLRQRLLEIAPKAETFSQMTWPQTLKGLRERGTLEKGDLLALDASQALAVFPLSGSTGERRGSLVAVVSPADLSALLQTSLDELARPSGLRVEAHFPSRARARAVASAGNEVAVVRRALAEIGPPLQLTAWAPRSTAEETFAMRRMRMDTLMSAISLLALLAGLGALTLAIRKELAIAHLKAEFVSGLSHQIRTPLFAITHISERLELGRYRSDEELHSFYVMLREAAQRLRELTDHALDFSRLVDPHMVYRKTRTDLRRIATDAEEAFRLQASSREFTVTLNIPETPLWIQADQKALVQAVINLLDNAVKYSPQARGRVTLTVGVGAACAFVSVADEGIGIASSEQAKVFDKFYRVADAGRAGEGGVGLGLAIVKQVVEGHWGRVSVRSAPGRGSLFTLELPMEESQIAPGAAGRTEAI